MPRAGARPGYISPEFKEAFQVEAGRLGEVRQIVDRIRAINDFYAEIDHELKPVAALRHEAIHRLRRAGWSYKQISEATDLSMTRVAQLSREARGVANAAARAAAAENAASDDIAGDDTAQ